MISRMPGGRRRFVWALSILLQTVHCAFGQDARPTKEGQPPSVGQAAEPYVLYDTKPVIVHGPYLVAPTETSMVIAWTTDTPSHSKAVYGIGQTNLEAVSFKDGLREVGTSHAVRVTGLKPVQTYQYQA